MHTVTLLPIYPLLPTTSLVANNFYARAYTRAAVLDKHVWLFLLCVLNSAMRSQQFSLLWNQRIKGLFHDLDTLKLTGSLYLFWRFGSSFWILGAVGIRFFFLCCICPSFFHLLVEGFPFFPLFIIPVLSMTIFDIWNYN